jgi:histone H3/H4
MEEEKEEKEVLIVISKLKAYIREKSSMNTAGNVAPVVSDVVRKMCDDAIARARADGRKTVMDRDFLPQSRI